MKANVLHGGSRWMAPAVAVGAVYVNYFRIYSRFFTKNRTKYWLATIPLILLSVMLELLLSGTEIVREIQQDILHTALLLLHLFVLNLFFIMGGCFWFSQNRSSSGGKKRADLPPREEKLHKMEAEQMRYKIAPHFLYNIINHILFYSMEKEKELPDFLHKLSSVLDYYLHDATKPRVEMSEEYLFYEKYVALESLHYGGMLSVDLEMDHALDHCLIAPLLFECYIGNAFKHTPRDGTGKIEIKFESWGEEQIRFTCKNNKIRSAGCSAFSAAENSMNLNKRRLDFLYGEEKQLEIFSGEHNYIVELTLRKTV